MPLKILQSGPSCLLHLVHFSNSPHQDSISVVILPLKQLHLNLINYLLKIFSTNILYSLWYIYKFLSSFVKTLINLKTLYPFFSKVWHVCMLKHRPVSQSQVKFYQACLILLSMYKCHDSGWFFILLIALLLWAETYIKSIVRKFEFQVVWTIWLKHALKWFNPKYLLQTFYQAWSFSSYGNSHISMVWLVWKQEWLHSLL